MGMPVVRRWSPSRTLRQSRGACTRFDQQSALLPSFDFEAESGSDAEARTHSSRQLRAAKATHHLVQKHRLLSHFSRVLMGFSRPALKIKPKPNTVPLSRGGMFPLSASANYVTATCASNRRGNASLRYNLFRRVCNTSSIILHAHRHTLPPSAPKCLFRSPCVNYLPSLSSSPSIQTTTP